VAETEAIARKIAAELQPGDIVALQGELGAGKTHFTKGLVAGLASAASVTSPTFTIVHEYADGRLPIYHFDFFRLENARAATAIALDDYFFGEGVCVVEWADRFPELIPASARWIRFEMNSPTERKIQVT
jgi:tRNA threonylcarbamoyladenosine biosynthesis protein TsaE